MAIGSIISRIINELDPGKSGKKFTKQAQSLWQNLELPEYERVVAPQFQKAGELTPETYDAIFGDFQGFQGQPEGRESQLRNLLRMEDVAREGLPLQDQLSVDQIQRDLAGEGSRAREAIVANLARRGRAGGGSELAAKLASAGDQEEAARGRGADVAQMSLQNRLAGMSQASGAAGQLRGMDVEEAARLSEMQNRYNEFVSNLQTQAAGNASRQRQSAQHYNLSESQRISDANKMAQLSAQQERNRLAQQQYGNQFNKTGALTGILGQLSKRQDTDQAAKKQGISALGTGFDQLSGQVAGGLIGPGGFMAGQAATPQASTPSTYNPQDPYNFNMSASQMYR